MEESNGFLPPPRPPPLLSDPQLLQLAQQGSLPLTLPSHIASLCSRLSQSVSAFMTQTLEEKETLYPSTEGTELGYVSIPSEKEYITLRSSIHPESELEQLASHAWRSIALLLHRILVDLGVALDLPDPVGAWTSLLDGCLTLPETLEQATPSLMRLFKYQPTIGVADRHADNGLLTLCVGSGPGLQCLVPSSSGSEPVWRDSNGPTLLVGHTLQALILGRLKAGVHRVVGNPQGRTSIVFALRASLRHDHIDLGPFGMPEQGMMSIRELWKRIEESKVNVNAGPEARAEQRQRHEERKGMISEERERMVNEEKTTMMTEDGTTMMNSKTNNEELRENDNDERSEHSNNKLREDENIGRKLTPKRALDLSSFTRAPKPKQLTHISIPTP